MTPNDLIAPHEKNNSRTRNLLFISHVQPDDNERAVWLYSRLKLIGYDAWCDLKSLKGGERDYWDDIQKRIEEDSCKFLLIVTKRTFQKDGVLDEFEFARSIASSHKNILDFILMLKFDDSPYNSRIGQNRYNHIHFNKSWADGFTNLIEKLEADSVPKTATLSNQTDAAQLWHFDLAIDSYTISTIRKERYYSNWWPIRKLPEHLYIYQYANRTQADAIFIECESFPVQRSGNLLTSWDSDLPIRSKTNENLEIRPIALHRIPVGDILQGFKSEDFPKQKDAEMHLTKILNRSLHVMLKRKGLWWYELANRANCYYFPRDLIKNDKCTFRYHNRKKTKALVGKYGDNFWHFGISFRAKLWPIICYSLQSHILFSKTGREIWNDKTALHAARRRKGRRMFNEEWRDELFAYLSALAENDSGLNIDLNRDFTLEMHPITATYFSDFGYHEPLRERQKALLEEFEEIDFYSNIDSSEEDEE